MGFVVMQPRAGLWSPIRPRVVLVPRRYRTPWRAVRMAFARQVKRRANTGATELRCLASINHIFPVMSFLSGKAYRFVMRARYRTHFIFFRREPIMHCGTAVFAFAAGIGLAVASHSATAESLNEFKHIVVIYQENHSFDNLYGLWGDVNGHRVNGLSHADHAHTQQVRQDNLTAYICLPQNDVNLKSPPLPTSCADNTGTPFQS